MQIVPPPPVGPWPRDPRSSYHPLTQLIRLTLPGRTQTFLQQINKYDLLICCGNIGVLLAHDHWNTDIFQTTSASLAISGIFIEVQKF